MLTNFFLLPPWLFTLILSVSNGLAVIVGLLITRKFLPTVYFKQEDAQIANIMIRQISTLLSVLMAFAVISTWQDYEHQRKNTAEEAIAMGNLYRDSRGLQPEIEHTVQGLLIDYTRYVVEDAWPKMLEKKVSQNTWTSFNKLYGYVIRLEPANGQEQIVFNHLLDHLNDLAKFRRMRLIRNASPHIPDILWVCIFVCTFMITFSSYFLRSNSRKAHTTLLAISGVVYGLIFAILLLLNHPYSGSLQISCDPLRNLLNDVYPMADITQLIESPSVIKE